MNTHTTVIENRAYTFSRPFVDMPAAKVEMRRDDGAEFSVNTAYAFGDDGAANPRAFGGMKAADGTFADGGELLPIATEIVAAARAFLTGARDVEPTPEPEAEASADAQPSPAPITPRIAALFSRYGSAAAAWDAGDEEAAVLMGDHEAAAVSRGLPEDH